MEKILFAADDSLSTHDAVDMVNHLLDAWPTAELTVLYVTSFSDYTDETLHEVSESAERRKAQEIERCAEQEWFPAVSDRLTFKHGHGPTAIAISTIAEEEGADPIVLGSHGTGEVDRLLVGSVSHGVLYCTQTPVMVVKNGWRKTKHN